MTTYSIGLDYGTNSVRGVLVDTSNGEELSCRVFEYPSGDAGILLDPGDPNVARQRPEDYVAGANAVLRGVVQDAAKTPGFSPDRVVGIGVDTTGSTPIPVDSAGVPLAYAPDLADDLDAMAVLWKDHTAHEEAAEITALASKMRPQYLAKCGGTYSSEWFWAKILHHLRKRPDLFERTYTWVEHADWQPAVLCGATSPSRIVRCICAAGHKAMFHGRWGGYPDAEFLAALDPRLARIRETLPDKAHHIGERAGALSESFAGHAGLPTGIPVSVGAFDAHLGAVGSGIRPGTLVKIIGTSSCDMMVVPLSEPLADIPGLCGIVPHSVLPGHYGLEAGQAAVGDIFNWYVNVQKPGGGEGHVELTAQAETLRPGQSGLLALDWHNGNRTVLVDQRLTGGIIGLTLHTTPAEMYRAWVESTAFGARAIAERFEEYGQKIDRVVNCGGIAAKNPMVMQIYADVLGAPIEIAGSSQSCALGAAMSGAVVGGAYGTFADAAERMTSVQERRFVPIPENQRLYDRLYGLYRQLHDAFGVPGSAAPLRNVMKDLLAIRDEVRS